MTNDKTKKEGTGKMTEQTEIRDRCGNEPWPCYHPLCANIECVAHRAKFPNCRGYSCTCQKDS